MGCLPLLLLFSGGVRRRPSDRRPRRWAVGRGRRFSAWRTGHGRVRQGAARVPL